MDPVARDYEIAALCNGIHRKVGTGRGQIPNEAEPKPNWSLMLRSRRIEKNRLGGQGDSGAGEVMAWLVCGVNARANITTMEQRDRQDIPPDGYQHGHSSKATNVVWRHCCGQRQKTDTERCDAEGMAGQADVLRAHSQGVHGAELA